MSDLLGNTLKGVTGTVGGVTEKAGLGDVARPVTDLLDGSQGGSATERNQAMGEKPRKDGTSKPLVGASLGNLADVKLGGGLLGSGSSGAEPSQDMLRSQLATLQDGNAPESSKEHARSVLMQNGVDVGKIM